MIPSFYKLQKVDVTESTNVDLKQAAEKGAPEGTVIQALRQTAGRGRQGRVWESPEGNMYLSILLRPGCAVREAGAYSFVTALAVFDTIKSFAPGIEAEIKWPNDVLVGGKKICGILLETSLDAERNVEWLVLGVGINILSHPDVAMAQTTSLAAEGHPFEVQPVLEAFLTNFEAWRLSYITQGFAPVRAAWRARARTGRVTARLQGSITLEGDFAGLDEEGHLILKLDDGSERKISAADVFFPDV